MKILMDEKESRLSVLREFLECAHVILWHFDRNMELADVPSDDAATLLGLMTLGGCRDQITDYCGTSLFPGFTTDSFSLMWLAEADRTDDAVAGYYVIGPVYTSFYSDAKIQKSVEVLGLNPDLTDNIVKLLRSVPSVQPTLVMQYGLLLHRILTGEMAEAADIGLMKAGRTAARSSVDAYSEDETQEEQWGRGYLIEQQIFGAIEQGNTAFVHPREALQIKPGTLSSDPLQSVKYNIVSAVAVACRAAIRGGLDESISYNLADFYINRIDSMNNTNDVFQVARDMFRDYTERVHRAKLLSGRSKEIQECISFLELHTDRTVSLQELADTLGYNKSYLCSKFHKETGMSVRDYAIRLKMERAGELLKNSDLSVGEISDALGYQSTSYFCALFKKTKGMRPLDYRNSVPDGPQPKDSSLPS